MAFLVVFFFIILLFCGTCISGHSTWAIVGDRGRSWAIVGDRGRSWAIVGSTVLVFYS